MELRAGDFVFTIALRESWIECGARDERYATLAAALESIALPELVAVLEERSGYTKEGMVGIAYAEENPGDVPPGKVLVFCTDEDLVLDREFFETAACEFASAAIKLMTEAGRPATANLAERVRAVRARI